MSFANKDKDIRPMGGRGIEGKEGNWVKSFINPVVGQYLPSGCVWWLHEIRQNLTVGRLVPGVRKYHYMGFN